MDTSAVGPELDRLVAERVMGWRVSTLAEYLLSSGLTAVRAETRVHMIYFNGDRWHRDLTAFTPSRDIANAWEVAEVVIARFPEMPGDFCVMKWSREVWRAGWLATDGEWSRYASAGSAPLAICHAALLAVGA